MVALIYLIILATLALVIASRSHDPKLLYQMTREDGVVEWLTVIALVFLSLFLLRGIKQLSTEVPKSWKLSAGLLSFLSLLAAGEEISWGQRIFNFEVSQQFRDLNYQNEANLHNLLPGELFNGVITFGVAIGFVLVPITWRKIKGKVPWLFPSHELSLLMLCIILVNHYRVSGLGEKGGIVLLLFLLMASSLQALKQRHGRHLAACSLAWLNFTTLFLYRDILRAANHQYEIRELLIIIAVTKFCSELLENLEKRYPRTRENPSTESSA